MSTRKRLSSSFVRGEQLGSGWSADEPQAPRPDRSLRSPGVGWNSLGMHGEMLSERICDLFSRNHRVKYNRLVALYSSSFAPLHIVGAKDFGGLFEAS